MTPIEILIHNTVANLERFRAVKSEDTKLVVHMGRGTFDAIRVYEHNAKLDLKISLQDPHTGEFVGRKMELNHGIPEGVVVLASEKPDADPYTQPIVEIELVLVQRL